MHKYRDVLGQVGRLAAVEAVCVAVILAVYFFLGGLDAKVLLGALIGGAVSVGHFLILSITVSNASTAPRMKRKPPMSGCPFKLRPVCACW